LLVSTFLFGHINAMDQDDDSNIGVIQRIAHQFATSVRSSIKKDDLVTMEQEEDDSNPGVLGQIAQSFVAGLWPIIDDEDDL